MGGADEVVNPKGAEQLHAAGGPKTQYWYESELEHVAFHREQVEEFERRIVEFFRTTLLAPQREDNL
jgi:hypothetical protein